MQNLFENFLKVIDALNKENVDYILIGGVAVILHGFERLTRDIDIFIKPTPDNIQKLKKALFSVYQDSEIEVLSCEEFYKYPVIRYGTPNDFYIDLIGRIGEFTVYEDLKYDCIEVHNIKVRIATTETLFKLKKDTIRDKDKMDARFLKKLIKIKKNTQ